MGRLVGNSRVGGLRRQGRGAGLEGPFPVNVAAPLPRGGKRARR